MDKQKRLFLAINIPQETKKEMAETLLEEIPKDKWRKIKWENAHITLRFLGHLPKEAVAEIGKKLEELELFDCFEFGLCGIGHFKNRVLWLGVGKGTEELKLLSKKTCNALGVQENEFHPHITLARNKGSNASETDGLIEKLRQKNFEASLKAESIDLMESVLHSSGPEYEKVLSIKFRNR